MHRMQNYTQCSWVDNNWLFIIVTRLIITIWVTSCHVNTQINWRRNRRWFKTTQLTLWPDPIILAQTEHGTANHSDSFARRKKKQEITGTLVTIRPMTYVRLIRRLDERPKNLQSVVWSLMCGAPGLTTHAPCHNTALHARMLWVTGQLTASLARYSMMSQMFKRLETPTSQNIAITSNHASSTQKLKTREHGIVDTAHYLHCWD